MFRRQNQNGFTLIELLLVVVIIGILLAVIVPRAWRANIDAKYGLVRQNCSELASFASQWAEQMLEAQNLDSLSPLRSYYNSLVVQTTNPVGNIIWTGGRAQWIGKTDASNWNNRGAAWGVTGRRIGDGDALPEAAIEDLVPPERLPRNPFTGLSVFREMPAGTTVIPGAIASGGAPDTGNWYYYALIFQGTDSTTGTIISGNTPDTFHAGMNSTLAGLRNGVFMARLQQQ